jgi:hypothetical protein
MSFCNCSSNSAPSDSPLSVTGNVVGILTFALGIAAYCIAFYVLGRGALDEIEGFQADIEQVRMQLIAILEYCKSEEANSTPDFQAFQKSLQVSLELLVGTLKVLYDDLKSLSQPNPKSRNPFGFQLRRRMMWARRRPHFAERMARVSSQKVEVQAIQTSFLLK